MRNQIHKSNGRVNHCASPSTESNDGFRLYLTAANAAIWSTIEYLKNHLKKSVANADCFVSVWSVEYEKHSI